MCSSGERVRDRKNEKASDKCREARVCRLLCEYPCRKIFARPMCSFSPCEWWTRMCKKQHNINQWICACLSISILFFPLPRNHFFFVSFSFSLTHSRTLQFANLVFVHFAFHFLVKIGNKSSSMSSKECIQHILDTIPYKTQCDLCYLGSSFRLRMNFFLPHFQFHNSTTSSTYSHLLQRKCFFKWVALNLIGVRVNERIREFGYNCTVHFKLRIKN